MRQPIAQLRQQAPARHENPARPPCSQRRRADEKNGLTQSQPAKFGEKRIVGEPYAPTEILYHLNIVNHQSKNRGTWPRFRTHIADQLLEASFSGAFFLLFRSITIAE